MVLAETRYMTLLKACARRSLPPGHGPGGESGRLRSVHEAWHHPYFVPLTLRGHPLPPDATSLRFHRACVIILENRGGCSSMAERRSVAPAVAGSTPVIHPLTTARW